MDAFLRKVVAQREREQEEALLAAPFERFAPRKCRVCQAGLRVQEESTREVCARCGGRKRQAELDKQSTPTQESEMSEVHT